MNAFAIIILKTLRKLYLKTFYVKTIGMPECDQNADSSSQKIYEALMADKPCMIARFGSNELLCLTSYLGVKRNDRNIISYITGKSEEWWWNTTNLDNMHMVAGFFPPSLDKFEKYCQLMIMDIPLLDILGSWLEMENNIENKLIGVKKVHIRLLEPFWSKNPWTKALEGKKILLVHPFEKEIYSQYKKKDLLFKENILPDFNLNIVKAIVSHGNEKTNFNDWFEALEYMKSEIDKQDYDICLIGAGAYGFHLAAHVKRRGKKAVHLGGALQLLFGIRGKRWEDPNYGVKEWGIPKNLYASLCNEHWVRPDENKRPKGAKKVEGGCYW